MLGKKSLRPAGVANCTRKGSPKLVVQPKAVLAFSLDKRTGDTEGAGIWGDSLGAISHIKLSQGAFRGNPPVSLVPPKFVVQPKAVLAFSGLPRHFLILIIGLQLGGIAVVMSVCSILALDVL